MVDGRVDVPEQRVVEPGGLHLLGPERRVRHGRGGRPGLAAMEQGEVDAVAFHVEPVQEPAGARGGVVCPTPQGQSVLQGHRGELGVGEDVHVGRPVDLAVRARRAAPVVVPGSQVHGRVQLGERRPQVRERVRGGPGLVEQVAAAHDRVDPGMAGERPDPVERRAQVGAQDVAERRPGPTERGVQVQVGDQQYPHRLSDLPCRRRHAGCAAPGECRPPGACPG